MKRLTTDDSNSILLGLNLFFVKDKEVWIRGGGPEPDYSDCTLTDWINRAAAVHGIELGADDAESLGDVMYDCLQYGVDATEGILALLHAAAVQAAEMRGRLADIENILGDDYDIDHLRDLVEADRNGRYVVQPKLKAWTDEEIAEITGFKCQICKNLELCCTPHLKPLCGEVYDHFEPKAAEAAPKGEHDAVH